MRISILMLLTLVYSCQNSTEKVEPTVITEKIPEPENIAYATTGNFEVGELVDSTYTNAFFGFELEIPMTWAILTMNNENLREKSETTAETDSTTINPSEENYFQLITLQQNNRIPLVNFMVEKIEPIPAVTNAKEYLAYTENYILEEHKTGFPQFIGHAVIESNVGDRPFLNQTFSVEFEQASQFQRNYCAQFGDYIFTIITHYGDQNQLDEVNKLLRGIRWNTK